MKRILIVEDDALLNKTLVYNLISDGYKVTSAPNVRIATELLAKTGYDMVLLDINLPDGNGFDLCRLIKPEHPDTVVIFLTANDQESDQILGYKVGAVDYIIGSLCGVILCKIFNTVGTFGTLKYQFPVMEIFLFFIALLLLQVTFSMIAVRYSKQQSLVERIKIMD